MHDKKRQPRFQLKGRQVNEVARAEVRALFGSQAHVEGYRRDLLIEYLHALNDKYRALFERHLVALAGEMRLPVVEVYEVASFYHHFEILRDDETPPEIRVRVCQSISCQLAGSESLMSKIKNELENHVQVLAAPCLGRCEQAPAVQVGQKAVAFASESVVRDLVTMKAIEPNAITNAIDFEKYIKTGGYELAKNVASGSLSHKEVLDSLEQAGLRGLGGAGFPSARKWRIVKAQSSPKLMAVNIDEGEPGTYKDRTLLESDPHRFLEGMLIASLVVGCEVIYIYLRDEYHEARELLSHELKKLCANPPFLLPKIELRRGAGAYICGEESAMIESIEGKRGEPRLRPPYIAEVGLFGRPTLEHNFETLYWIRDLLEKGAETFVSQGRNGRHGLRRFSVSGRVKNPGVKLAPAGISLLELIDEYCDGMAEGHELYAYLPGGASGGILPARLANIPLDFDTLQPYGCFIGSAAVMVLSQADRARDAALNAMKFFADESCGQCTPCRVGTVKAASLMAKPIWDRQTLEDLAQVMGESSICGLGQAAPNAIQSVLKYFPNEVEAIS
jgi:NADH:ubiquinone oxidoreductase subunit F (NADH-binding)/NADH:ubiquinone oxidoreductase subunit E